jgi:hypothetical protein
VGARPRRAPCPGGRGGAARRHRAQCRPSLAAVGLLRPAWGPADQVDRAGQAAAACRWARPAAAVSRLAPGPVRGGRTRPGSIPQGRAGRLRRASRVARRWIRAGRQAPAGLPTSASAQGRPALATVGRLRRRATGAGGRPRPACSAGRPRRGWTPAWRLPALACRCSRADHARRRAPLVSRMFPPGSCLLHLSSGLSCQSRPCPCPLYSTLSPLLSRTLRARVPRDVLLIA